MTVILEKKIKELQDGERFSLDGETWHTCALVGFDFIAVYAGRARGDDAMTYRIWPEQDHALVTQGGAR